MWQSHLSYHPRIGYTYTPGFRSRLTRGAGGYLLRANDAGFRCEHEFVEARPEGQFRALLFGDSQTAGLGVNNDQRFGDIVETLSPGLEVYNYGLDGTGTDQQYQAWREFGGVEHDLLIIGLYVEDIERVNSRYLKFADETGQDVWYGKPYYEVIDEALVLRHTPAPKRPWTRDTLPADAAPAAGPAPLYARAQAALKTNPTLHGVVRKLGVGELVQRVAAVQRAPDYGSPDNPGWLLLARILTAWIAASAAPVLLLPIPMWTFVEQVSDASGYQARFHELAEATGARLHDPLPDLWAYGLAERRGFRIRNDTHMSPMGHRALALSLAPTIARIRREAAGSGSVSTDTKR